MSKAEKNQNCPKCGDTCVIVQECCKGKKWGFISVILKDHFFFCRVIICIDCFIKLAPKGLDKETVTSLSCSITKHVRGKISDD